MLNCTDTVYFANVDLNLKDVRCWSHLIILRSKKVKNKYFSSFSSFNLNSRPRRSVSSKTTGCSLGTCVYHDLLHDLYRINNKPKDAKAPLTKMGRNGYGRRRRSLLGVTQLRRSSEAGQLVRRHKSTCTVA